MGILSGPEILKQVKLGRITITPFDESRLGPNSYDCCLGDTLLVVEDGLFDLTQEPRNVSTIKIPGSGYILKPGIGYLGSTVEQVRCDGFVPWIDGRSSVGRWFLQVHQTAGRGDDGWEGHWTLEMMPMYRSIRVYAGMPIAQTTFFTLEGERKPYAGCYSGQTGPTLPKPLQRP